ncbi:NTE family protein [Tamilnaduibacter salinus]|uniref:NTE family protein n=1 Tax=Tamilnaduibacter salinus TaxID=1484056 RepID=A0A2U1CZA3_9GAMM|nr:patatin-like phospholipase family protein [Tamilnaduibacter salinus]PVY78125.1 NTE family protein [Tamilnaduibacter salinus]
MMSDKQTPRRALVLGCGGVAGAAWSIATLHQLERQLDWDARDADVLIGTSAGAVLAALLGSGTRVDQLLACQEHRTRCGWDHDRDSGGALPPLPGIGTTGPGLVRKGLRRQVSPLTALSGLMPRGRLDMTPFRRLIDRATNGERWVTHPATWLMAVDTDRGNRVAFGHPDAPSIPMSDAVCASYGVPAWCPPLTLNGRRYIDGGVASPTSADILVDADVEDVIILAPMASRTLDRSASPLIQIERGVRRYMTAIVDREVALLERAGKRVIRLEPGPADLRAFGFNMMDPGRRHRVLNTALRTSPGTVSSALR